jgi:pyruvate formate-lyase activating enzyme-like uncharacterized protein
MRKRLERRIKQTIRDFEQQDATDPLLVLGIVRGSHGKPLTVAELESIQNELETQFEVPIDLLNRDDERIRIEIAPWILEEIASDLRASFSNIKNLEIGIAYEYPTWDRLQTMFDPL